jgi:hypothetical protein
MKTFTIQSSRLLVAGLFLVLTDCTCRTPPLAHDACLNVQGVQAGMVDACKGNGDCADHYRCLTPREGTSGDTQCCIQADRACVTEADCCPGQTCPADRKKCFDKYLPCDTDAECGDKGDMFCEVYTDTYGSSGRCRFHVCGATGQCPAGQSCFQGECMVDLPCGGTCEAGKACVASINRCQDYSTPDGRPQAACPMSCAPGFIATFKDARNIWDSCNLPEVQCVCAELPSLQSGDLGRHSAIAEIPGQAIYVSAYDGQYGDLVLYRFDAQGVQQQLEYVDGVPQLTPTYGPSGARGGVVDPGEDVGRYTDIAISGDKIFISYYDVTNGDLKLAWKQGASGTWTKMRVDGATANLGLYSSIAIDQDGLPGIAYFQKGGESSFDATTCPAPAPTGPKAFITALKFAKATTASPSAAGDFSIKTIGCQSRPTPACYGCTTICADANSTGPSCYTAATGCTSCDPNTETCVMVGTTPTCGKKYNPSTLNDVPEGVGLFSALAFNGKDAFIAYMKRTSPAPVAGKAQPPDGDLYGVRVGAQGTVGAPVLIDATGDTGFFPDVKIDPQTKNVAVSYHDFTSRALKFESAATFTAGLTPEVIDSGLGAANSGEWDWVGSDSALVFGGPGQIFAVYQDPTKGDLKWAQRQSGNWVVKGALETNGAVGFFADGLFDNGNLFTSHAKIHAKLVAGEPKVDNSLLLTKTPAP